MFNYDIPDFNNKVISAVQSGDIWKILNKKKSIGDGHCLIYSIVESFNSQTKFDIKLDSFLLLNILRKQTLKFKSKYSVATNGSETHLLQLLNDYIYSKAYNSDFCDIVPLILAEALCVTFCIINGERLNVNFVETSDAKTVVYLLKTNDHYDSLLLTSSNQQNTLPLDSISNGNLYNEQKYAGNIITNESNKLISSQSIVMGNSLNEKLKIQSKAKPFKSSTNITSLSKRFTTKHGLRMLHINCRSFLPKKR